MLRHILEQKFNIVNSNDPKKFKDWLWRHNYKRPTADDSAPTRLTLATTRHPDHDARCNPPPMPSNHQAEALLSQLDSNETLFTAMRPDLHYREDLVLAMTDAVREESSCWFSCSDRPERIQHLIESMCREYIVQQFIRAARLRSHRQRLSERSAELRFCRIVSMLPGSGSGFLQKEPASSGIDTWYLYTAYHNMEPLLDKMRGTYPQIVLVRLDGSDASFSVLVRDGQPQFDLIRQRIDATTASPGWEQLIEASRFCHTEICEAVVAHLKCPTVMKRTTLCGCSVGYSASCRTLRIVYLWSSDLQADTTNRRCPVNFVSAVGNSGGPVLELEDDDERLPMLKVRGVIVEGHLPAKESDENSDLRMDGFFTYTDPTPPPRFFTSVTTMAEHQAHVLGLAQGGDAA